MVPGRLAWVLLVGLAACGDDPAMAPADAPPDVEDMGPCGGGGVVFTGELIDFASTPASFPGIPDRPFTVRADTPRTPQTAPNGRFELCLTDDPETLVDITPSAASGYVGGVAVVTKEVATNGVYSIRSFTTARGTADFEYKADRAHVFVHVAGTPRTVAVSATSERTYAFDGADWQGGEDRGTEVYFANVDPTGGSTKITVPDAAGVPAMIPLEPGTLTFVVVIAP